jgi:hypothetical protein
MRAKARTADSKSELLKAASPFKKTALGADRPGSESPESTVNAFL